MSTETINSLVKIGDIEYPEDQVTPAKYFDYVKGMKQNVNEEDIERVVDGALKLLEKTQLTGQVAMAAQITHEIEVALRVLDASKKGFDIFVTRKDVERFIEKVDSKTVKIIELEKYSREIPDEVIGRLAAAKNIFDKFYIVFTDYALKETKQVAKERREKDPIMFGAFLDKRNEKKNDIYIEDKLFFIADWVEDKCDLTLKEIVQSLKDKEDKDIVYRVSVPEDEAAVKEFLKGFDTKVEDSTFKPDKKFLDKFKDAVDSVVGKVKKKSNRKKKSEKV